MSIKTPIAKDDAMPGLSASRMPTPTRSRAPYSGGHLLNVPNAVTTKTEQDLGLYFCHYRYALASVNLALQPLFRSISAVNFLNDGMVLFRGNGLAPLTISLHE